MSVDSVSDPQAPASVDRHDLLERLEALRQHTEEIGAAALMAEPTKACDRLISGLLDSLNSLEALLSRPILRARETSSLALAHKEHAVGASSGRLFMARVDSRRPL